MGAAPEPETRGIWIRFVPRDKVTGIDGSTIVLLDTEGFYGEGATRSYDARVFALATLASSHLVYNTLRTLGILERDDLCRSIFSLFIMILRDSSGLLLIRLNRP